MAKIPEEEISRLVREYAGTVRVLARDFVARVTMDDARVSSLTRDALAALNRVDRAAAAWANKNLFKVYDSTHKEVKSMLKERRLAICNKGGTARSQTINKQAMKTLALDPGVGLLSSLQAATDAVRLRLRLIKSQARILTAQQQTINETIAQAGLSSRKATWEIKRSLVTELATRQKQADRVWKRRATGLGPNHIFANLANLPYVAGPAGRSMRLDHYAELVIRTKASQAETMARRNAMREHCQTLVSISRNTPLDDDACNLYVGRAFALTAEAAEEFGVPHVDQLPGGGAPFHPNCTHTEVPFFPEIMKESVVERSVTPPPSWALGRPWSEVQKEYVARGGKSYAAKQNPNLRGGSKRSVPKSPKAKAARAKRKEGLSRRQRAS